MFQADEDVSEKAAVTLTRKEASLFGVVTA